MEQMVQRMVIDPLLAARRVTVQLERQGCQSFRQDADAGIHCRRLHSRELVHRLATGRGAEQITEIRADIIVLRLVPGTEQAG